MRFTKKVIAQHDRIVSIVLNLTAGVAVLFGVYLLAVPSMQKNAAVGPYSWERLGMAAGAFGIALALGSAYWFVFRRESLREKRGHLYETWLKKGRLHLLWDTGLLFVGMIVYLLVKWNFISDPHSLVPRLNLFLIVFGLMGMAVLASLWPLLRQARPTQQLDAFQKVQRWVERHKLLPAALGLGTVFLVMADLGSGWMRGTPYGLLIDDLFREFDLGWEYVLPAYFSGALLLLAGGALAFIALWKFKFHQKNKVYWLLLSAIFFYMAADEVFLIHEVKWRSPWAVYVLELADELHVTSYFHYTWTATGVVFLLIFGLVFLKFFLSLPNFYKIAFLISGMVFVGGALGVEMIAGNLFEQDGYGGGYNMLEIVEEGLEMTGMVIFLFTLTRYIREMSAEPSG